MNYTIATTEDVQSKQAIDMCKKGNQYALYLANNEIDEMVSRTFDKLDEAVAVYTNIVEAFLKGMYSWETRKALLK